MSNFSVIVPSPINGAMLTSSTVPAHATTGPDPDPALWSAGTAYVVNDRATYLATNSIYVRVVAGTTAGTPNVDTVNWVYVGATNRWRMFDESSDSKTVANEQIIAVVTTPAATYVDSLVVFGCDADLVEVTIAGTSYAAAQGFAKRLVRNWTEFFFARVENARKDFVFTKLPLIFSSSITLTIKRPNQIASCSNVVIGRATVIGTTHYGAVVGINDYSIKSTDSFGNTSLIVRPYSKRMSLPVTVLKENVDGVQRFLADYRAKPLVFVGAENDYSALLVYGFYKSFEVVIAYFTHSKLSLDVEGLIK